MNLRSAATFPCNPDKSPISQRGFKDAMRGVDWRKAPLVGFPTGAVNGLDVLDIDGDAGRQWYDANYDAIPATRAHATRRGMHLLFRRAPGLRCTESKIAEGVDVRAEGGYVIWWPREGFPVEDAPISEWPDWLREEAMLAMRKGKGARRSEGDLRTSISKQSATEQGDRVAVESIREALDQLDPCAFEGDRERWVAFMNGAKAIGAPMELFTEWTSRNPAYERNDDEIERNWHSVRGLHAGAFYAELKAAGIKFTPRRATVPFTDRSPEVTLRASPTFQPSLNRESRFINLIEKLKKDGREDLLFWTSCELAGMVLIEGWPREHVARRMLEEASCINGLRASLGAAGCKQTIDNAFAHIANKLEEAQS